MRTSVHITLTLLIVLGTELFFWVVCHYFPALCLGKLSYADFAGTLFGFAALLLTAVALIVGIVAFVGYGSFKSLVSDRSKEHCKEYLQSQEFKQKIPEILKTAIDEYFKSDSFKNEIRNAVSQLKITISDSEPITENNAEQETEWQEDQNRNKHRQQNKRKNRKGGKNV